MALSKVEKLPSYLPPDLDNLPKLNKKNHTVESKRRDTQNCIAYAAGDDIHYWWPIPGDRFPGKYTPPYFWPEGCPEAETLEAFKCAFKTVGFIECDDGESEEGVLKIAFFGTGEPNDPKANVLHAARQSPYRNKKWRSKLGVSYDIDHDLTAVEGPLYGKVIGYMKRPEHT